MVGAGGARFVTAATMLPSGSAFALASAAADAPPTAIALLANMMCMLLLVLLQQLDHP